MKFLKLPIVISVLVSVGLIAFALWGQSGATKKVAVENEPRLKAVIAEIDKDDTDGDSLADWEETLWQTDPKNPDTDGDGTKDNDEIKQNRNPLKKAPGDSLVSEEKKDTETPKQKATPLDFLSQDLLKKYLSLKQTGQTLSSEDAAQIADSISKSIDTIPGIEKNDYIYSDIETYQTETADTVRGYGNVIGKIFVQFFPKEYGQEAVILERALKNQDKNGAVVLLRVAEAYGNVQKNMLSQTIPQSAVSAHISLLNAITHHKEVVIGLQKAFDDPILALQALKEWKDSATEIKNALEDLSFYFEDKNIVFNKNEYGSTFNSSVE